MVSHVFPIGALVKVEIIEPSVTKHHSMSSLVQSLDSSECMGCNVI